MFEWHYVGQYGPLGPLSQEQMLELVDSGVITYETYVWKPGMADWKPAAEVSELKPKLPPPAPPPVPSARPEPERSHSPASHRAIYAPNPPRYDAIISPSSRIVAGLLQFIPGVGRMYLGYMAIGILQLIVTFFTCGLLYLWPVIDGILIMAGSVKVDGYGRLLRD